MKLLGTLTSPYARKARVVLAEKKIDFDWIIDSPNDPNTSVTRYNPLARVPVLVLDDDAALFDSPVIVEYLDNLAPNNKLFPQPSRERVEVKRWEALADGVLDAAVGCRMEQMRPVGERSENWMKRELAVIDAALERDGAGTGRQALVHGHALHLRRHRRRLRAGLPRFPLPGHRLARPPPEPRQAARQADAAAVLRRHCAARHTLVMH